jgi:putative FmdB family regulatory protein
LPLYAYRCTTCGNKFEKIQNFSAEPETICPKCGNATLIRPLTAPRLNFKGAGWYINDYASKSSESSSDSSSESKPAESKEPSKSEASKSETSKSSDKPAASSSTPGAPSAPASTPKSSTDS